MSMGPMHGSGGRRARGRRNTPMADINVTPMVDVMLVLLIIFMVTAPLMVAGVPVNLPESRAKALDNQEAEPVQISIDGDGAIFVGDEDVPFGDLPARLAAIAATNAGDDQGPQVTLRADTALQYGRVMQVMGELNRAGLNRVSLVTSGVTSGVTTGSETAQ
jgi:biopolymer transport protein TolR